MKSRGEEQFISMPGFTVKLYDHLTSVRGVKQGFEEIARFVCDSVKQTKFRANYQIRKIELGNLPVYVRLELNKE